MSKCKRCGQCCFELDAELRFTGRHCEYLFPMKNGEVATCIQYYEPTRIGTKLSIGCMGLPAFCSPREVTPCDYRGCPYNTNKKLARF